VVEGDSGGGVLTHRCRPGLEEERGVVLPFFGGFEVDHCKCFRRTAFVCLCADLQMIVGRMCTRQDEAGSSDGPERSVPD